MTVTGEEENGLVKISKTQHKISDPTYCSSHTKRYNFDNGHVLSLVCL